MAEMLGTIAKSIATTTITFQLYQAASDLYWLLKGFKPAPAELLALQNEINDFMSTIKQLETVLSDRDRRYNFDGELGPSDNLFEVLKSSKHILEELNSIVLELNRVSKSTIFRSFEWVEGDIRGLRKHLTDCRRSLISSLHSDAVAASASFYVDATVQVDEITNMNQGFRVSEEASGLHDKSAKFYQITAQCRMLLIEIHKISIINTRFISLRFEILRLHKVLIDLQRLVVLKSTIQIPKTDYLPALIITSETLNLVLESFAPGGIQRRLIRRASWGALPERQHEARNYISRVETARAALIAAQLAVTSRYSTREKSTIAAISKNLDFLPCQVSTAIRAVFQDQVDAAGLAEDVEEKPAVFKRTTHALCTIFGHILISIRHYTYRGNSNVNKWDKRRINLSFLPAAWLLPVMNTGWNFILCAHSESFEVRMTPFHIVPTDRPIFVACAVLDIGRIRHELSIRNAAPFDIDVTGRGLMDIALDAIISVADITDPLETDTTVNLQTGVEVVRLLLEVGCSFAHTGLFSLRLSFGSRAKHVSVKPRPNSGFVPGWIILSLFDMDQFSELEFVWAIRETSVLASEIRPDWWYHIHHIHHIQLDREGKLNLSRKSELLDDDDDDNDVESEFSSYANTVEQIDSDETPQTSTLPSVHHRHHIATRGESRTISERTLVSDAANVENTVATFNLYETLEQGSTLVASISNQDKPTVATDELIRLLEQQLQLKRQFSLASTVIDAPAFQELMRTLLRAFGASLMIEASSPSEEALGQMVVLQSAFIATVLRRNSFPEEISKLLQMDSLRGQGSMTMEEKLDRLWKSLEANQPKDLEEHLEDETLLDYEEKSDLPFLSTIQGVQGFMLSSDAFLEMQRSLQSSISTESRRKDPFYIWSAYEASVYMYRLIGAILQGIMYRMRPPVAPGYQRLEWKCECGDELYADFKNSHPEDIENLKKELEGKQVLPYSNFGTEASYIAKEFPTISSHTKEYAPENITVATANTSTVRSASISPRQVAPAHSTTHSRQASAGDHNQPARQNNSLSSGSGQTGLYGVAATSSFTSISSTSTNPPNIKTSPATSATIQVPKSTPVYMEVCVKHKRYVSRHKEVQVYLSEDDYHFFKRVKDAYLEIRRPRWNIFLRPFHIKHVQFSVQNMGSVVGIFHHDGPRIPPEEDVQNGLYHYHPCPWPGEPVPSSIILHELNSKKSQLHTSRTWSTRIPKKCAASIFSVPHPDDVAIGYGIHIIEDCDSVVLIIMLVIGLCVTALVTALWWSKGKPGDIQGATGLGSLLLGSFGALALCYQSLPSG